MRDPDENALILLDKFEALLNTDLFDELAELEGVWEI